MSENVLKNQEDRVKKKKNIKKSYLKKNTHFLQQQPFLTTHMSYPYLLLFKVDANLFDFLLPKL